MKYLLPWLCICALAACSSRPPPVEPKPAPPTSTPFDALRDTTQRARNVQKLVDQSAAQQRQQIDAASQ